MEINELRSKVTNPHDVGIHDRKREDPRDMPQKDKFRFFVSCTYELLLKGTEVELDLAYDPEKCKEALFEFLQKNFPN